jgi:hypothetical protein
MSYTYGSYNEALTNIYFHVFTINGNSEVDLTRIKGDKYKNSFYTKFYYPYTGGLYIVNVLGFQSLMLSTVNIGETNITLAKENEDILVKSGEITYISLGFDKKSINISSNMSGFYWTYEFSQTDDINFLPRKTYGLSNYEVGNTTYIKNPHYFQPNNTNYYWFITFKHLHNESIVKFTYEYISEKSNEKQPDESKSFFKSITFWIILLAILAIIIVVVVILLIRKNNSQKYSSKIETLVDDVPKQELM